MNMSDFKHTTVLSDKLEATLCLAVEGRDDDLHDFIDNEVATLFEYVIRAFNDMELSCVSELVAHGVNLDESYGELTRINYAETHELTQGDIHVSEIFVVGQLVDLFAPLYGLIRHEVAAYLSGNEYAKVERNALLLKEMFGMNI